MANTLDIETEDNKKYYDSIVRPNIAETDTSVFGSTNRFLDKFTGGYDKMAYDDYMKKVMPDFNYNTADKDSLAAYNSAGDEWKANNMGIDYSALAGLGMSAFDSYGKYEMNKQNMEISNSSLNLAQEQWDEKKKNHDAMKSSFSTAV